MPLYQRKTIERYRKHLVEAYQEVASVLDDDNVTSEFYLGFIHNDLKADAIDYCELKNITMLQEACDRLLLATKHLKEAKSKAIKID